MARKKTPVDRLVGDKPADKPVLYLRLTLEHEAALQTLIARQRIRPDRTAVGLTALEELLAKEGLWPPRPKAGS